jgi:ubiquinone/menaquinone biosynthesis C-methylase UbiE
VDPVQRTPLVLETSDAVHSQEILTGFLRTEDGTQYPIRNGVPRFVLTQDIPQLQTGEAFAFKWKKRETYDSPTFKEDIARWCIEKYGFESLEAWADYFNSRESILDVGCGSGFSSSLWLDTVHWHGNAMWVGVDISAAIDVASERLRHLPNTHFVQADALCLPFADGGFDTIFAEGALHHTPSTRAALLSAARALKLGGAFHFYVYRRKGPIREFTDDYIRREIASLTEEEAWDAMRSLTQLAQALADLRNKVVVPQDVPLLGLRAGEHDVQRIIYWHFAKLYWNETFSFEENVHINFDWYRPWYAHRQTAEEVRNWCAKGGLSIEWFHEQDSGFTVKAIKR